VHVLVVASANRCVLLRERSPLLRFIGSERDHIVQLVKDVTWDHPGFMTVASNDMCTSDEDVNLHKFCGNAGIDQTPIDLRVPPKNLDRRIDQIQLGVKCFFRQPCLAQLWHHHSKLQQ
jgi:hypothetical protein